MNRKERNLLAENLRHYISGTITNFEFIDRIKILSKSNDRAIIAIEKEFWFAYSDLKEHRNVGKKKLCIETENHIKRFILFLKSDNEYEWKNSKYSNSIKWIIDLISFEKYLKKSNNEENQIIEKGDKNVWPFFRESELKKEIDNPKYLN